MAAMSSSAPSTSDAAVAIHLVIPEASTSFCTSSR